MLKPSQIHAARTMAALSIEELATAAGLKPEAVSALESGAGSVHDPAAVEAIKRALEKAGLVFTTAGETDVEGDAVFTKPHATTDDGIRPGDLDSTNDD